MFQQMAQEVAYRNFLDAKNFPEMGVFTEKDLQELEEFLEYVKEEPEQTERTVYLM